MDRFTEDMLNLRPRSREDLRSVVDGFEQKWQAKIRRIHDSHGA